MSDLFSGPITARELSFLVRNYTIEQLGEFMDLSMDEREDIGSNDGWRGSDRPKSIAVKEVSSPVTAQDTSDLLMSMSRPSSPSIEPRKQRRPFTDITFAQAVTPEEPVYPSLLPASLSKVLRFMRVRNG